VSTFIFLCIFITCVLKNAGWNPLSFGFHSKGCQYNSKCDFEKPLSVCTVSVSLPFFMSWVFFGSLLTAPLCRPFGNLIVMP
jgi:hypothetical protein